MQGLKPFISFSSLRQRYRQGLDTADQPQKRELLPPTFVPVTASCFLSLDFWFPRMAFSSQQFHALKDLLMRLFGSFAVLDEVIFFFIPVIRLQNDFLRPASFSVLGLGAGGFNPGLPGFARL